MLIRPCSAGITSLLKVVTVFAISSNDISELYTISQFDQTVSNLFLVNAVDLMILGTAECTITIIAASIPVLRLLVRDVPPTPNRFFEPSENSWVLSNNTALSSRARHSRGERALAIQPQEKAPLDEEFRKI